MTKRKIRFTCHKQKVTIKVRTMETKILLKSLTNKTIKSNYDKPEQFINFYT